MPEEVKKIVQERLKETSKEKDNSSAKTDMYLEDFKKSFGAMESRNAANRSNKPIASQLDKSGGKFATGIRKNLRILDDDDSDEDDQLLGRDTSDQGNSDLRQSFGKPKAGGALAQMKAKLSL